MKRLLVFCSLTILIFFLMSCNNNSSRLLKFVEDNYQIDMPDNTSIIYKYSETYIDGNTQLTIYQVNDSNWSFQSEKQYDSSYHSILADFSILDLISSINNSKSFNLSDDLKINSDGDLDWFAREDTVTRFRDCYLFL